MNKPNQANDNASAPVNDVPSIRWAVIDIQLLKLILKYSYMFQETQGPLVIAQDWIATFAAICTEIDQLLGKDKRGFHWQQLGHEGNRVAWYWTLGEDYAPSVVMYRRPVAVDFGLVTPPGAPENKLRDAIRAIVLGGEANARKQFKAIGMEGDAA